MRTVRAILLSTLVVGIAMTLALGPSGLGPRQAAAQTGYGDTGPFPPRSLFVAALDTSNWTLLIVAIAAVLALIAAAVRLLRRRRGEH